MELLLTFVIIPQGSPMDSVKIPLDYDGNVRLGLLDIGTGAYYRVQGSNTNTYAEDVHYSSREVFKQKWYRCDARAHAESMTKCERVTVTTGPKSDVAHYN
jgi:hypothetical protein